MAANFPNVKSGEVGAYVGAIASAFAVSQLAASYYFWGWFSDRIGRKPVILLGTALLAVCFVAFGFCRTFWQAALVQTMMGAVSGNQSLLSTCLGEITDRSSQAKALTYLPLLYGLGGITGPLVGGLLVFKHDPFGGGANQPNPYPYLAPNLLAAVILLVSSLVAGIFLKETLEDAAIAAPSVCSKLCALLAWVWQATSSVILPNNSPIYHQAESCSVDESHTHDSDLDSASELSARECVYPGESAHSDVFTRDSILLLATYFIFAFSNASFSTIYPVFAQAPLPGGRALTPLQIGLSLAFVGVVSVSFHVCIFGRLRNKMGNKWSYRAGLFGFIVSFSLMPFLGNKGNGLDRLNGTLSLFALELCSLLLVRAIASVAGLISALLLVSLILVCRPSSTIFRDSWCE